MGDGQDDGLGVGSQGLSDGDAHRGQHACTGHIVHKLGGDGSPDADDGGDHVQVSGFADQTDDDLSKQISKAALVHHGDHQVDAGAEDDHVCVQRGENLFGGYNGGEGRPGRSWRSPTKLGSMEITFREPSTRDRTNTRKATPTTFCLFFCSFVSCFFHHLLAEVIVGGAPAVHDHHVNAADDEDGDGHPGEIQHARTAAGRPPPGPCWRTHWWECRSGSRLRPGWWRKITNSTNLDRADTVFPGDTSENGQEGQGT